MKEKSIHYHPGIYRLGKWPFFHANLVTNERNEVPINFCNVSILVGSEEDMKNGYIATVLIEADKTCRVGITNFFADIATNVRLSYFSRIFYERINDKHSFLNDDSIRWIEHYEPDFYPEMFPKGTYKEVKLTWNFKNMRYGTINWIECEPVSF